MSQAARGIRPKTRTKKQKDLHLITGTEFDALLSKAARGDSPPERAGTNTQREDIVYKEIRPTMGVLQSLYCLLWTREQILDFLSIPAGQFPNLVSLRLGFMAKDEDEKESLRTCYARHETDFTVFKSNPNLQVIDLLVLKGPRLLQLGLPMSQLVQLTLPDVRFSPDVFLLTMLLLPSLSRGSFQVAFNTPVDRGMPPTSLPFVALPRLLALRLILRHPNRDPRLFVSLALSSLQFLALHWIDDEDGSTWSWGLFIPLLSYASKTLGRLDCYTTYTRPVLSMEEHARQVDLMHGFLSQLPKVMELTLPGLVDFDRRLQSLVASGYLLPSVRTLRIAARQPSDIIGMVVRRNERVHTVFFHRSVPSMVSVFQTLDLVLHLEDPRQHAAAIQYLLRHWACRDVNLRVRHIRKEGDAEVWSTPPTQPGC